jgi:hypothetical protein
LFEYAAEVVFAVKSHPDRGATGEPPWTSGVRAERDPDASYITTRWRV